MVGWHPWVDEGASGWVAGLGSRWTRMHRMEGAAEAASQAAAAAAAASHWHSRYSELEGWTLSCHLLLRLLPDRG